MEKLLTDKLQCKNIWKGELSENLHLAKIKQWVTSDLVDSKRVNVQTNVQQESKAMHWEKC